MVVHYDYDTITLDEMELRGDMLYHPCPCGDEFTISLKDFLDGGRRAQCPTCSLTVHIDCSDADAERFMMTHAAGTPIAA